MKNDTRIVVTQTASPGVDLVLFHTRGSFSRPGISKAEFDGEWLSTLLLHEKGTRQLHVGLGEAARVHSDTWRQAAGVAARTLVRRGGEHLALDITGNPDAAQAVVEGALLGAFKFETFRMPESRRKHRLKTLTLLADKRDILAARAGAGAGFRIAGAVNLTREIGNTPPNVITPAALAARAVSLARELRLNCRIWDERALQRGGFGGILAVGQGSINPPRFVVISPRQRLLKAPTIAVIGKAITFDSGGISIKPADRMEEMKWDKMGGCAVLGVVRAVTQLKLPVNLFGIIASAENLPGPRAYRPSDIVTTWDGKTIEVLNTDAEGRVVLADALAYARVTIRPDLMLDMATLTGACVVALGTRRGGVFATDAELGNALVAAGESTGDRLWPMPMGEEYEDQIKSDVALVKNTGGREGGACTAASFLKQWAADVRWAHLDIAGPAYTTKELPHIEKGATGFGVRLITEFLRMNLEKLRSR
jgi:leucyl aminopeptidase